MKTLSGTRILLAALLAGALLPLACDHGLSPATNPPASLLKISGDKQAALVGQNLAWPVRVQVLDSAGNALDGVAVGFEVVSGSAAVQSASATTSGGGFAETRVTLGATPGAVEIRASVPGTSVPAVAFTATAATSQATIEFVKHDTLAPALERMDTTFWAIAGRDTVVEILYLGKGKAFLTFKLDEESLFEYPDSTPFLAGDSVLIQITVIDLPDREFITRFQPDGLKFNPLDPAELQYRYEFADSTQLLQESEFKMWLEDLVDADWDPLQSIQFEEFDEIEAEILHFTRYALAIG